MSHVGAQSDTACSQHPDVAQGLDVAPRSAAAKRREQKIRWIEAAAARHTGTGCVDWPWAVNSKGYAVVRWNGQQRRVGHLVLELSGAARPERAAMQLHSCDRPRCVARWHLRWGTAQDNVDDMIGRGRTNHRPRAHLVGERGMP